MSLICLLYPSYFLKLYPQFLGMELNPPMNRRRGIVFASFEMAWNGLPKVRLAYDVLCWPAAQCCFVFWERIWVWGGSPPVGKWVTSPVTSRVSILRGPLASLNGISVNLAELFLKLQGLFLNVFRTIPKIWIYIYIYPNMTYITLYH